MRSRAWSVVGAGGMLGRDLADVLRKRGQEVRVFSRDDLDVTDVEQCVTRLGKSEVVVNCAAYTAVDAAETDEAAAFAVNALGAANVARASKAAGARLVHVSTDYVFDMPRRRAPIDIASGLSPASAYGRTKAAGEWAVASECADHLIVRTAWLYGEHGPCFPKTIARLLTSGGDIKVVSDQIGQPTWTVDLADLIVRLIAAGAPVGTYHGTSSGEASWHDFAVEVAKVVGTDPQRVQATSTAEFPRPAPRPAYSALSHASLTAIGLAPIGHWRDRWTVAAQTVLTAG